MALDSSPDGGSQTQTKTLQSALDLLQSLRPQIMNLLAGKTLHVALNRMHIMNPRQGRLGDANVLWLGPAFEDDDARLLKAVCGRPVTFIALPYSLAE
jgi:hypothetical protein